MKYYSVIKKEQNCAILETWICLETFIGFPGGASGKEPTCQCRKLKEMWV